MLVKVIKKVPARVFNPALTEIGQIDWSQVTDYARSKRSQFATSKSISIRRPVQLPNFSNKSVNEWSKICDCEDTPDFNNQYMAVRKLAEWMFLAVSGKTLGRMMIVNLAARGSVSAHIDPGDYFEMYSRFHVPIKTNPGVVFSGGPDTEYEHMPYQHLCRLNNRLTHQLDNNSDENRIHLIVDIETEGGNKIF